MIYDQELFDGRKKAMPEYQPNESFSRSSEYVVSPDLKNAINVALMLGQPILLTGEPGTGKTQLAHYLAENFSTGLAEGEKNLFIFNTKSTSAAKDLFYTYKSLQHFQYAQSKSNSTLTDQEIEEKFIEYQALGAAIKSGKRCVVLIDEIDKAPRDFPNDILDVLEHLEFEVPEINKVGKNSIKTAVQFRPIIIMTSNSEKTLPDPFLRRCVFYHIPFPNKEMLLQILRAKNCTFSVSEQNILVEHFEQVRAITKRKKPSTAELLYWVSVLEKINFDVSKITKKNAMTKAEEKLLIGSYTALAKNQEDRKILIEQIL